MDRFTRCVLTAVGVAALAAVLFIVQSLLAAAIAGAFGAFGVGAIPAVAAALGPVLFAAGFLFVGGTILLIATCIVTEAMSRARRSTRTAAASPVATSEAPLARVEGSVRRKIASLASVGGTAATIAFLSATARLKKRAA